MTDQKKKRTKRIKTGGRVKGKPSKKPNVMPRSDRTNPDKDRYDITRQQLRSRSRFYGLSDGTERYTYKVDEPNPNIFLTDSTIGRLTAMNFSQLPRRRLGSLNMGLNYTAADPTKSDFHVCSRDLELRESAQDFVVNMIYADGLSWAILQAVLNFSNSELLYLLTQDEMFQDLWSPVPENLRGKAYKDKTVKGRNGQLMANRSRRTTNGTGDDEPMRLPTRDDFADECQCLFDLFDDFKTRHEGTFTPLYKRNKRNSTFPRGAKQKDQPKDPQKDQEDVELFDQAMDRLGFDYLHACRRAQRLLLVTGRMETFLLFRDMFKQGDVTTKQIQNAIKSDDWHMQLIGTNLSRLAMRKTESQIINERINSVNSSLRYVAKSIANIGRSRDKTNGKKGPKLERLNELVKLKEKHEKELEKMLQKRAELTAKKAEKRGGKASVVRTKKPELLDLAVPNELSRRVDSNFEKLSEDLDGDAKTVQEMVKTGRNKLIKRVKLMPTSARNKRE